jgi:hypothetical protein
MHPKELLTAVSVGLRQFGHDATTSRTGAALKLFHQNIAVITDDFG